MATTSNMYFMFSSEQLKMRITIEAKLNKRFKPGTVIVNGVNKPYTEIVRDPNNVRYKDSKIVMFGDLNLIKYTEPTSD